MRGTHIATAATLGLVLVGASAATAGSGDDDETKTKLKGYAEVPAISTTGNGRFEAELDDDEITYELKYRDLTAPVLQSHIHFGQFSVNGGISVFLCSNLGNGPAGTQACPAGPAVLEGTVTPDLVLGPGAAPPAAPGQGIEPGAFAEIAAAIKAGVSYANVHTTKWPGGEIRGQLR
jgi:hypothetical protein